MSTVTITEPKDLGPAPERPRIPVGTYGSCALPRDLEMPPPVAAANAAMWALIDRERELGAELRIVRVEAEAAPAHDKNAVRAAAVAGADPPEPIAPLKLKRKQELEEQLHSLEGATGWAAFALADAVRGVHIEWYRQAVAEVEADRAHLGEALDELLARFVQLRAKSELASMLLHFDGSPHGFSAGSGDDRDHLESAVATKLDQWRRHREIAPGERSVLHYGDAEVFAAIRWLLLEDIG